MRTALAAALGLGVFTLLETRGRVPAALRAVGAAATVLFPLAGLAFLAGLWAVGLRRRLRSRRLEGEAAERDVVLLADLVALGLRAGLGLLQALQQAANELVPLLAAEVSDVVGQASRQGSEAALATARGRAERLYRIAARASATGAPLADAVEAFAVERRHADHARAVEAARRLPVRMLLPLALLILPGFVVLAVGPALLEALDRLQLAP